MSVLHILTKQLFIIFIFCGENVRNINRLNTYPYINYKAITNCVYTSAHWLYLSHFEYYT